MYDTYKHEIRYIQDYCKKTGFIDFVKTEQDIEYIKYLVKEYGFMKVQEAIRIVNLYNKKAKKPVIELKNVIYKSMIKSGEIVNNEYNYWNNKQTKEVNDYEKKLLGENEIDPMSFNNFTPREYDYKKLEWDLLGWNNEDENHTIIKINPQIPKL